MVIRGTQKLWTASCYVNPKPLVAWLIGRNPIMVEKYHYPYLLLPLQVVWVSFLQVRTLVLDHGGPESVGFVRLPSIAEEFPCVSPSLLPSVAT